jgi:uncharacterized protein
LRVSIGEMLEGRDSEAFVPFFEGCRQGKLLLPRCRQCELVHWYPLPLCSCGSADFKWCEVSPTGHVYSYCVVRHAYLEQFANHLPIVSIIVDLDDVPVRYVSTLVDCPPERAHIDMQVEGVFRDPFGLGQPLLYFRPRKELA